jgi:hypothetical protein
MNGMRMIDKSMSHSMDRHGTPITKNESPEIFEPSSLHKYSNDMRETRFLTFTDNEEDEPLVYKTRIEYDKDFGILPIVDSNGYGSYTFSGSNRIL